MQSSRLPRHPRHEREDAPGRLAARESRRSDRRAERRGPGVVGNSNQVVETLARPVFPEHLLFRDEDYAATMRFAFTNEIAALEIGREANDIEGAWLGLRHFILFSEL